MTATGPMDTSLEVANNWGDIKRSRIGRMVSEGVHNKSLRQRRPSKDHIAAARLRSEEKYSS